MGDSGIQRARHWLKANLNIWWEAEECRTRFFKAAEQLPLRNCKWSASWQEGQMQFETLRIFNSLLTSAFQGIHNWVQTINISLNTSGAILELLTFWRSDCVIYPLLLSCMVADLKSKYRLFVEFWYSISHHWSWEAIYDMVVLIDLCWCFDLCAWSLFAGRSSGLQHFLQTPKDTEVAEGGRAVLTCQVVTQLSCSPAS